MTAAQLIRADAAAIIASDHRFAEADAESLPIEIWGGGFGPLIHLILGQQVSIEAADAMYTNLEHHLGPVTPPGLLGLDDDTLRSCGFTRMKAEYGRGLAMAILDGFDLEGLASAPDEAVVSSLTGLRGIGSWTAECYLIFCLGRRDVFPVGDLALRVGYQELADLDSQPTQAETAQHATSWAPRRTAAAYLVWQAYLERRGRAASVPFA